MSSLEKKTNIKQGTPPSLISTGIKSPNRSPHNKTKAGLKTDSSIDKLNKTASVHEIK